MKQIAWKHLKRHHAKHAESDGKKNVATSSKSSLVKSGNTTVLKTKFTILIHNYLYKYFYFIDKSLADD